MNTYGLIGYPLEHSFSKDFFNRKFKSEHIDAEYVNFQIDNVKELKNVLNDNPTLCGLNVTLPYKTQVMPLLDEIDQDARLIGAVNVIKFIKGGRFSKSKLKGYNSDIIGFKESIEPLLNMDVHRHALILGTGGASKAVYHGLKQLGIEVQFVARVPEKDCITYDEISSGLIEKYTVIVNATPLGMYPHIEECPNIPYESLTSKHLLYDLLYNPDETQFMRKGKAKGATVKNGLEMLLLQAFVSWDIWNM